MVSLSREKYQELETEFQRCIAPHVGSLDSETRSSIDHYLFHGEIEIAFEILGMGLMNGQSPPDALLLERLLGVGDALGLKDESVYDPDFWQKFERWAEAEKSTPGEGRFGRLLAALSSRGLVDLSVDLADERERFRVCKIALAQGDLVAELIAAVGEEQDLALQSAVFAELLEVVPAGERRRVLAVAPESAFLERRASELDVADVLQGKPELSAEDEAAVRSGSDWLQRRLVERALHRSVLGFLAREGSTQRIRAAASERARHLASADERQ